MSRAFVREQDGADLRDELPDRPVSPHQNLVTAAGLAAILAAVEAAQVQLATAREQGDAEAVARALRDLRYWQHRKSSAEVVPAPPVADRIQFGSVVTLQREDGRRLSYRIVGEDEADPAQGTVSYVAPLAQALLGREVGDVVVVGRVEAEIVAIG